LKTLSEFRDHCGQNLLHFACSGDKYQYHGHLYPTIRLLLNAGCDPNAIDISGNAPLHYLAQLEKSMVIDLNNTAHLLLDFGAQLSVKNADGKTAIDFWIEKHGDQEIIDWKLPDWCSEPPTLECRSASLIIFSHNSISNIGLAISIF